MKLNVRLATCCIRAALIGTFVTGMPLSAAPPANKMQGDAALNFVNADIESVIRAIGPLTGKTFLIDPKVQGTLTVISGGPVDRALIYPILLSALRSQGFTAIEAAGVVRIAPESEAKHNYSPTFDSKMSGDRVATAIFNLKNQPAAQVLQAIRPLIGPNQAATTSPGSNTIVVTDVAENLKRVKRIIDVLDVPTVQTETVIVPLKKANAQEVAALANQLLSQTNTKPDMPGSVMVIAEPRNNSILVRSDSPALRDRAVAMVQQFDDTLSPEGNIRVIRLRNAEAVKLAQTLRSILSGGALPSAPSGGSTFGGAASLSGTTSAVPGAGGMDSMAGRAPDAGASGGDSTGGAQIQADPATNSLIITASEPMFRMLRDVIEKLDTRRAQVFVEVLIAEVTSDFSREFGVQWQSLGGGFSTAARVAGGTNFTGTNNINQVTAPNAAGRGLNIGVLKGTVSVDGTQVLSLGLLARVLQSEANSNILSAPNLLTLDNEEARIVIGQNVPIVTGSFTQTGTAANNPFQTYERRDVGINLKVRPQITESGAIRLMLSQEVSSLTKDSSAGQPIFNKRSIDSTVLVDDGRIVVLGGLLSDDTQKSEEKIPLLGDIPVLGHLFRYDTTKRSKTNLMVFLRPQVLRDEPASTNLSRLRMGSVREAQQTSPARPGPTLQEP